MWRSRVFFLACGLALLCVGQGPAGADDAALIDPSTTIVTVDGVPLSAGLILVPAGKDLEKWWAGEGHDSATQERVRKHLAMYSEATVDTELIRAWYSDICERGGPAKTEALRPVLEKYMPIVLFELRKNHAIDDWSRKSANAEPYISDWLTSRADAGIAALMSAQVLLKRPEQAATVRAHWAAHRDDYLILKSARWRQITVLKGQDQDVERELHFGIEFDEVATAKSMDRFRQEGGLVESESPHRMTEDRIISALKKAEAGKLCRVNHEGEVIFMMPEKVDVVPAKYEDISEQVLIDLANLNKVEVGKAIAAKRRVKSRIEWEMPVNQ